MDISKAGARKAVLVSMVALLAISFYRSEKGDAQGSLYKRLWGTSVLGIFLSLLADFVPEIAGPFAVVTVLGSLTNGGDKALQKALGSVGTNVPKPTRAAQTTRNVKAG